GGAVAHPNLSGWSYHRPSGHSLSLPIPTAVCHRDCGMESPIRRAHFVGIGDVLPLLSWFLMSLGNSFDIGSSAVCFHGRTRLSCGGAGGASGGLLVGGKQPLRPTTHRVFFSVGGGGRCGFISYCSRSGAWRGGVCAATQRAR